MTEKLFRSRKSRILGGVAGGLAEYFKIDPVITRILFIAFTLTNGIGVVIYIILWIIIPDEPMEVLINEVKKNPDSNQTETKFPDLEELKPVQSSNKSSLIFGIIIIALGVFLLLSNIVPFIDFDDLFPVIFIIIGAGLIWNSTRSKQ